MTITDVLKEMDSTSPPFQPKINAHASIYKERLVSWNPVCIKKDALFYQFITTPQGDCVADLIPDACMNLLFKCDEKNPTAVLSGIFLEPKPLELEPNTVYFGFKPYSNLGMKPTKANCAALTNASTDFDYIYPNASELMEKIALAQTFDERIKLFMDYAHKNMIDYNYTPSFIDYFTVMICASKGNITFNNLEQVTGYSERYCREKFKDTYGLSPKRYSGMMRFQSVLKTLLVQDCDDLSALAFDNGYFDQAHFIHDFKKFTASSPYKFKQGYMKMQSNKLPYSI